MCTCPNYMIYEGPLSKRYSVNGKHLLWRFVGHMKFDEMLVNGDDFIAVPCGKCLECKLQYTRSWADRCVLESMRSEHNYFITLTYDDEHMPENGSLVPDDLTKFIKRLRKHYDADGEKITYFACGEYGDSSMRPHYHICFFNLPLDDLTFMFEQMVDGKYKVYNRKNVGDGLLYSRSIYKLWHHKGIISVAPFNYDTAAYVAQYCTKKLNKNFIDQLEKLGLVPEFLRMSKGMSINAYDEKLFDKDKMVIPASGEAHLASIPRYYEKRYIKDHSILPKTTLRKRQNLKEADLMTYNKSLRDKDNEALDRSYRLFKQQKTKKI